MERKEITKVFVELGKIFQYLGEDRSYDTVLPISEIEFDNWNKLIIKQAQHNGWFTKESVRKSLLGLSQMLTESKLGYWLSDYQFSNEPKKVGIVMAGNIPLVGFHDFLCVVLSGNKAIIKLSSSDQMLFPKLLETLMLINTQISSLFELAVAKLGQVDAVIATGSNNSMRFFEEYFGHLPHIFRNNRTSIAIFDGNETEEDFVNLGNDIFSYFGLGCRNVSKVIFPIGYEINTFFQGIVSFGDVINHHKYANNYDYNKAVHLLNNIPILDNNFVLLKETEDLFSPLGMIHYQYMSKEQISEYLESNKNSIQAIVGKGYIPFGQSQFPNLDDYADGIDTMRFLQNL